MLRRITKNTFMALLIAALAGSFGPLREPAGAGAMPEPDPEHSCLSSISDLRPGGRVSAASYFPLGITADGGSGRDHDLAVDHRECVELLGIGRPVGGHQGLGFVRGRGTDQLGNDVQSDLQQRHRHGHGEHVCRGQFTAACAVLRSSTTPASPASPASPGNRIGRDLAGYEHHNRFRDSPRHRQPRRSGHRSRLARAVQQPGLLRTANRQGHPRWGRHRGLASRHDGLWSRPCGLWTVAQQPMVLPPVCHQRRRHHLRRHRGLLHGERNGVQLRTYPAALRERSPKRSGRPVTLDRRDFD